MGVFDDIKKAIRYVREPGVSACFMGKASDAPFEWFRRSPSDSFQEPLYLDLIKIADVKDGDIILDVGCGYSPLLDLKDRAYEVVGLDRSEGMLEMAKEKERAVLVRGDAENLPYRDNCFNAVISKDVLQYISDREKATEEMARVVKLGKKVAITITPLFKRYKLTKIERALKKLGFYDVGNGDPTLGEGEVQYVSYVYGAKPIF